ncbi:hypothetical protein CRE_17509 [Caenorhabditis remanei]|uniref:Uncharacterized protein n=1 Tax=Caenorhabditis remanei TaxID=31234 RepID=E3N7T0_CAERE|nr:hypothetical protein CRE_17509 [Caenorhabditis remanei]
MPRNINETNVLPTVFFVIDSSGSIKVPYFEHAIEFISKNLSIHQTTINETNNLPTVFLLLDTSNSIALPNFKIKNISIEEFVNGFN